MLNRHRRGCDLTSAGEEALESLREANASIQNLKRRVSGHRQQIQGTLRIAIVDAGAPLLLPLLNELRGVHPGLRFDVLEDDAFIDLASGGADLAVRLTLRPPSELVGRCHGTMASAPYVHRSLASTSMPPWLALHPSMGPLPQVRWEEKNLTPDQVWLRMSSGRSLQEGVRSGLGAGILPCIIGDPDPYLVRLAPPDPTLELQLWTLYHQDLRRAARLRAVVSHVSDAFKRIRPVLEGELQDAEQARRCLQGPVD